MRAQVGRVPALKFGRSCCRSVGVLALLALAPSSAYAQELSSGEWGSWRGPASCIQEAELLAAVRASFSEREVPPGRRIEGQARREGAFYRVELKVWESELWVGSRVLMLPADDCHAHDESLVLVYALLLEHGAPTSPEIAHSSAEAIDPETSLSTIDSPSDSQPATRPFPSQSSFEPPMRKATTAKQRRMQGERPRWSMAAAYLLHRGWVKGSVGGVELQGSLRIYRQLWLGVDWGLLPAHRVSATLRSEQGQDAAAEASTTVREFTSWAHLLSARACWQHGWSERWSILGCLGGGLLLLRARDWGVEQAQAERVTSPFVALRAQLRWHFLSESIFLFGQGELSATWRPAELVYQVDGLESTDGEDAELSADGVSYMRVFETSPWMGSMAVGVGVKF